MNLNRENVLFLLFLLFRLNLDAKADKVGVQPVARMHPEP